MPTDDGRDAWRDLDARKARRAAKDRANAAFIGRIRAAYEAPIVLDA